MSWRTHAVHVNTQWQMPWLFLLTTIYLLKTFFLKRSKIHFVSGWIETSRVKPSLHWSWTIMTVKYVNTYLDVEILSLYNIPQTQCIHRLLFMHTFVYTMFLCLVSQPISHCPICKQGWIIKYVVFPEATLQVCIFQWKLKIWASFLACPGIQIYLMAMWWQML